MLGHDPAQVLATKSEAFVRLAPRPAYSVLRRDAWQSAGVAPIQDWSDALAESIAAPLLARESTP